MIPSCSSGCGSLAHERRRFGYRRLHVLLRREGFEAKTNGYSRFIARSADGTVASDPKNEGADAGPAMAEPPLVARLRGRPVARRRRMRILVVVDGCTRARLLGTTSRQASRCRMPFACGTSCSTKPCSAHLRSPITIAIGDTGDSAGRVPPFTRRNGAPLRCSPPTSTLHGPPPQPPSRAWPTASLQLPLEKNWGATVVNLRLKPLTGK